ncbi:hypothetical protein KSS87_013813 [Heliosperma pusillum]|nr:hypothetical protein KSS87_013813 [Heliosperma pusillum]
MADYFGNVPDLVIDKIIEKLPIHMAAQTSVLSKPWRRAWLSLKSLMFEYDFWGQQTSLIGDNIPKLLAIYFFITMVRFTTFVLIFRVTHLMLFLSGGGIIRSTSVTFKHLDKLCLSDLNLNDSGVFHYILSMIECCPYIKTFEISVYSGENVGQNIVGFNHNYKLDHLRKITIKGITGSSEELKLVEHLLAISGSLENLFFRAGRCDTDSELKMSRALIRFPRASTKASIICLDT